MRRALLRLPDRGEGHDFDEVVGVGKPALLDDRAAREALPKYRCRRPAYLSSWSAYNHLQLCSLSAPFLNGAVVEPPTGERSTGAECDKLSDR